MTPSTRFNIINAVVFQVGWFICVLYGNLWAGLFTAVTLILHFKYTPVRRGDLVALVLALAFGVIHDAILLGGGLIQFAETRAMSPLWVLCVWVLLGINLNHSLRWVYERPWIGALLGAICGPLSYLAGERLSSANWTSSNLLLDVVPLLVIMWALVLPLHRWLSQLILQRFVAYV